MLFFAFLSLLAMCDLPVGGGALSGVPSRLTDRLCASRLRGTHCCDPIFADLDDVAARVSAAREAPQAFRSPEDDCVGVAAGLDHVALLHLLLQIRVEAVPASP